MKPINLDAYANRTVDFMLNGKLVKVPELTHRQYEKVIDYENKEGGSLEELRHLVVEMLNRNTCGVTFTEEDVANLPQGAVLRIYTEIVMFSRKPLSDPN